MMSENLKVIAKLLEDYSNFIEKRSNVYLIVLNEIFPKILEWHFSIWKKEHELLGEEHDLEEWDNYRQILASLDDILENTQQRAFKEGNSYSFFRAFKKHVEKYKNEFVEGKDEKKFYYVESIISIFYVTLVENIRISKEKHDIWNHYFPPGWKITIDNIEKKENIVSKVLLSNFLDWARERFWQSEDRKEYDKLIDELASNLFPSVETILWAKLLTLVLKPWIDDDRMKSLVEEAPNFGLFSRVFVNFNDTGTKLHDIMRSHENNTMALAIFLFKNHLTKDILANL